VKDKFEVKRRPPVEGWPRPFALTDQARQLNTLTDQAHHTNMSPLNIGLIDKAFTNSLAHLIHYLHFLNFLKAYK